MFENLFRITTSFLLQSKTTVEGKRLYISHEIRKDNNVPRYTYIVTSEQQSLADLAIHYTVSLLHSLRNKEDFLL